jgi:hypothetical protein
MVAGDDVRTRLHELISKKVSVQEFVKEVRLLMMKSKDKKHDKIYASLNLVFRQAMDKLLDSTDNRKPIELITFAFDFALAIASDNASMVVIQRLPYVLVEDLLQGRTIGQAAELWTAIEKLADKLTNQTIFARGKMQLLKSCNGLAKRLSKACNAELLGKLLIFLARAYPIADGSAVNKTGRVNPKTVTLLEDLESFRLHADPVKDTDIDKSTEENKNDNGDKKEGKEMETPEPLVGGISYHTYQMFWGLQRWMSAEVKTLDNIEDWKKILTHADVVLSAFEGKNYTFSELELKNELDKWEQAKSRAIKVSKTGYSGVDDMEVQASEAADEGVKDKDISEYMGTRYLTSSTLLPLQLRDPLLRQQLSAQLLFFTHHIRTRPPLLVPKGEYELTKEKSSLNEKEKKAYAKKRMAAINSWNKVREDLNNLERRVYALLAATPPNGNEFAATLRRILVRENNWIRWKFSKGCESFQRNASNDGFFDVLNGTEKSTEVTDINLDDSMYTHNLNSEEMTTQLVELAKKTQKYEEFIEFYTDAEDPECGIDEEYHPKHDQLYCWRARRLMAENHLHAFDYMNDGDICKGLARLTALKNGDNMIDGDDLILTVGDDEAEDKDNEADEKGGNVDDSFQTNSDVRADDDDDNNNNNAVNEEKNMKDKSADLVENDNSLEMDVADIENDITLAENADGGDSDNNNNEEAINSSFEHVDNNKTKTSKNNKKKRGRKSQDSDAGESDSNGDNKKDNNDNNMQKSESTSPCEGNQVVKKKKRNNRKKKGVRAPTPETDNNNEDDP